MALDKNFDAQTAEARILQQWLDINAFAAGANKSRDQAFTIMIPPPNVTGALHMGHAFNNTLQDILVRWHRMRGFDTLWQPGQDHAGIATQMQVEKMLAATQQPSRAELGREAFLEKIWAWKEQYGGTIISQLQRLGASCDWSRNAFTMDPNFHDAVIKVFVDLYNKGLIYRGKRLVNWDPHFETAISDLEVENIEVDGFFWHFKYPLAGGRSYRYIEKDADGNVTVDEERDYIAIATTRPETMLGDGAVAVHPSDERYAPIVGALCEIPVGPKEYRRLVPIITDDYPDPDFGSGAVKITGAHDFNDYAVAKRNKIPLYNLMDTRAHMRADGHDYVTSAVRAGEISRGAAFDEAEIVDINLVPEDYRGLDRFVARKKIVAEIDAEGLMIKVEPKKIMQPFTDRSKVVMEPYLTDQWYVDAAKLAGPALDAVRDGRVEIIPERDKKVYFHWLENIEPWAISRQLWWGHQIPVWYDSGGNQYCAATEVEAQKMANEAIDNPSVRNSDGDIVLTRDPDVLDTWFSSGLWPIGTLGWPADTPELARYFPTSVLVTGFDILFFWVARMMMMQLEVVGQVPFHTVYLHALVRDENGVKMSKTLGNVIDPLELIDEFGADAVRMTMTSMAAIGGTLKLSRERVTGYRNFGTKLWNIAKFAEFNAAHAAADFDPCAPRATLNRWIIGELAKTRIMVDEALGQYRFNDAANGLYAFVWNTLADWYVEFSKPLLNGEDAATKAETQATLGWVLDHVLILLHPIMPFITETLWAHTGARANMLVHQNWPEHGSELIDAPAEAEMAWTINLIERIRSTRQELHVPAGAKLVLNQIELAAPQADYFVRNRALIDRLARIEAVEITDQVAKGAVSIPVDGGLFALPLAGVIDVNDEIARLQKSLDKLAKEQGGLDGRLKNPKFVDSAPVDVVTASRARLSEIGEEMAKLDDAMERMRSLL